MRAPSSTAWSTDDAIYQKKSTSVCDSGAGLKVVGALCNSFQDAPAKTLLRGTRCAATLLRIAPLKRTTDTEAYFAILEARECGATGDGRAPPKFC